MTEQNSENGRSLEGGGPPDGGGGKLSIFLPAPTKFQKKKKKGKSTAMLPLA